jgi:hypothetical protein
MRTIMSTATTAVTAGKPFAVETTSMELRDDGTGNSKHLMKNAKKRAEDCPCRKDQEGGFEVLKKRLDACVEEFYNSIFDTRSNESLVSAARKLILKSGKKKSNLMATLSLMHPKYKDELHVLQVGGARPEAVAPAAAGTGANRRGAQGAAHGGGAAARRPSRGLHGGTHCLELSPLAAI